MPAPSQAEFDLMTLAARSTWTDETRARLATLLGGEIDWERFLVVANSYGVAPLASRRLASMDVETLGEDAKKLLAARIQRQAIHGLSLMSEALRLLQLFRAADIPALPYKGPLLAAMAYGDPALRPSGDLDFLVQRLDLDEILALLAREGYSIALKDHYTPEKIDAYLNSPHEYCYPTLAHEHTGLYIELHFDFTPRSYFHGVDVKSVWRAAELRSYSGVEYLDLTPVEWAPILCLHGARHHWTQLKWTCDIAELLRSHPEEDWSACHEKAENSDLGNDLLLGFHLAHRYFNAPLPELLKKKCASEKLILKMADQVNGWLRTEANQTMKQSEFWGRLLFQFRLRSRWSQRIGYLAAHFLDRLLPESFMAILFRSRS